LRVLGAPENLALEEDAATEFQVIDLKYGFKNHSWAHRSEGAKKKNVFRRETVRIPYLAPLLREDLQHAEKLFCFHDSGRVSAERIKTLMQALGRTAHAGCSGCARRTTPARSAPPNFWASA
jgi:hypothetical protein